MAGQSHDDLAFCQSLPKLECHAHLNGSIPDATLQDLISLKASTSAEPLDKSLLSFKPPDTLTAIDEFFPIFSKVVYRLTDNPHAVGVATKGVLEAFRADGCMYLELRTTLRRDPKTGMTYRDYLHAVLAAFEAFDAGPGERTMLARLIVSVNWNHPEEEVVEIMDLAVEHRRRDRRGCVVGVDVCGDPSRSDPEPLRKGLARARAAGLKLTLHFGEIEAQLPLLESHLTLRPDRLGHATFLTPAVQAKVVRERIPIEICIGSNVKCKTVASVQDHHVGWALDSDVPVLICSDDMLVFRNPPSREYATALSVLPGGRRRLWDVVRRGIDATFTDEEDKGWMRRRFDGYLEALQGR